MSGVLLVHVEPGGQRGVGVAPVGADDLGALGREFEPQGVGDRPQGGLGRGVRACGGQPAAPSGCRRSAPRRFSQAPARRPVPRRADRSIWSRRWRAPGQEAWPAGCRHTTPALLIRWWCHPRQLSRQPPIRGVTSSASGMTRSSSRCAACVRWHRRDGRPVPRPGGQLGPQSPVRSGDQDNRPSTPRNQMPSLLPTD